MDGKTPKCLQLGTNCCQIDQVPGIPYWWVLHHTKLCSELGMRRQTPDPDVQGHSHTVARCVRNLGRETGEHHHSCMHVFLFLCTIY